MGKKVVVVLAAMLLMLLAGCDSGLTKVAITSDVGEAVLSIDGEEVGVLPQIVKLEPGTYQLAVEPPQWWQGIFPSFTQKLNIREDAGPDMEIELSFFARGGRKAPLGAGSNPYWSEKALWFTRDDTLVSISSESLAIREYSIGEAVEWLWASSEFVVVRTETGRYFKLDPASGEQVEMDYDLLLPGRYGVNMLALREGTLYLVGWDEDMLLAQGNLAHGVLDVSRQYLLYVDQDTRDLVLKDVINNDIVELARVDSIADLQFSPTGKYFSWQEGDTRYFRQTTAPASTDDWNGRTISGEEIKAANLLWATGEDEDGQWEGYMLCHPNGGEVISLFGGQCVNFIGLKHIVEDHYWFPREWQQAGKYLFSLVGNEDEGTSLALGTVQRYGEFLNYSVRSNIVAKGVAPGSWHGSRCGKYLAYVAEGELVLYYTVGR